MRILRFVSPVTWSQSVERKPGEGGRVEGMSRKLVNKVHGHQAAEHVLMGNSRQWPPPGCHEIELRCKEEKPICREGRDTDKA